MALSNKQIAIIISRRNAAKALPKAANDATPRATRRPAMLDACIAAAGFDQHAAY